MVRTIKKRPAVEQAGRFSWLASKKWWRSSGFDNPATEADIAIIKNGRLSWCNSPLWIAEVQCKAFCTGFADCASDIGLAIAGLGAKSGDIRRAT